MEKQKLGLVLAGIFWALSAVGGYSYFFYYESRPVPLEGAPKTWPKDLGLKRDAGLFQLVVAVHPRCPCTRASIAELNRLMQGWKGKVKGYALLLDPEGVEKGWTETDISERLKQVPHLSTVRDPKGSLAARFGATASGQTLLYNAEDQLVFDGGVTTFRGHEGPSLGQEYLKASVEGKGGTVGNTKVFGCSLKEKVCKHGPVEAEIKTQKGGSHDI